MNKKNIISKFILVHLLIMFMGLSLMAILNYFLFSVTADEISAAAFFQYYLKFMAIIGIPLLAILSLADYIYIYPIKIFIRNSAQEAEIESSSRELAQKRVYQQAIFLLVRNCIIFSIGFFIYLFCFDTTNNILSPSIIYYFLFYISLSLIYAFIQFPINNKIFAPIRKYFKLHYLEKQQKQKKFTFYLRTNLYITTIVICIISFMIYRDLTIYQKQNACSADSAAEMKGVSLFADDNSQVNTPAGIQPSAAGGRVNEMNLQYYVFPIMILLIFLLISLLGSSSFTHEVKLQIANQQRTMEGMLNGKNNNIEKVVIVQNDELGELSSLINKYIDKFNVVLETIFKNTGQVKNVSNNLDNSLDDASSAIHEMVVSVKQISTSTNHQITIVEKIRGSVEEMLIGLEGAFSDITSLSSFVQETSSAMGETTASIKTISDNTDKINKLEESLVRISKAGNVSVNNNIQAIRDIEKASKLIVEIVGMISDIASQTDLLAINAAIESAHAGNKGKGFAVVADEIRKLAEKSKQNASQIIEYIKDMNNKVQKGVQLAVESGNAFNKIDEEINLSNKLISEVSQALQEQSRGTGEILNSISEMLKSTIELKEIADDMQSKSENIHKHMEDLFNISTEINNATDEQDKSNRNISVMITNVKDVSTKNISLLNDLNSAITNFDTLKISN